ncbi:MAG TPA: uroporphyrinogen decarboxylase [Stellaceae bacterium]|nr:uroporphyrinogen decarboxylase [Stellaceae bacterium]
MPTTEIQKKAFLRALAGERLARPPWWLMRQAGRYLPEYRAVRARAPDFIALCLSPALAAEVTLQPVRRYGMDAAILFSDILLVPHALGQGVRFREGEGPVLDRIADASGLSRLDGSGLSARLAPVFETVSRVAAALPAEAALIGFAGSPWTVATYMAEGGTSRDFRLVKGWAYRDPQGFGRLIDMLVEMTTLFLAGQIEAGAQAVQLFDSWAGLLPEAEFERWVIAPTRRIVERLKSRFPHCPIIGFPRGAGLLYERYVRETGVDAIGCDTAVPAQFMCDRLQPLAAVQGNLDPVMLLAGESALEAAAERLRRALGQGPYIFNLGHGVLPETSPEAVASLARLLARPIAAEGA